MREGFLKALTLPSDSRYLGIYAFLTDGFIGNESEIHKLAKENASRARSFAFGIGSSVNRFLCDGVAEHGQGKAIYCLPRDGGYAEGAVDQFFAAIDSPVLCDISIDWGELNASGFAAQVPRDLFAGEPLQVCARIEGKGKHTITVNGRVGGRAVSLPIEINLDRAESHPAIAAIWARRTVDDMSARLLENPSMTSLEGEITELGVAFNIVTKYTAFIAVDESRVNSDGKPLRIMVPVEMPEGVTFKEGEPAPRAVKIEKWGLTLYEHDGAVYVAAVDADSPAAKMGMVKGQQLLRVNGIDVTGVEQVERLLLQSPGNPELETRVNDEGREVDARFTLPDPTK
jgi:Ca-activated chloride channel family protein